MNMKSSLKTGSIKKILGSLPDFWFLAILLVAWVEMVGAMFAGAWHTVNIVLGICLLTVTFFEVWQLFNRKVALSSVLGFVFLLFSIYLLLALFSELAEF